MKLRAVVYGGSDLPHRPREAAMTIVRLVNSKNLNQAMLALTVSEDYIYHQRKNMLGENIDFLDQCT